MLSWNYLSGTLWPEAAVTNRIVPWEDTAALFAREENLRTTSTRFALKAIILGPIIARAAHRADTDCIPDETIDDLSAICAEVNAWYYTGMHDLTEGKSSKASARLTVAVAQALALIESAADAIRISGRQKK
mgnify:CR=1 FL=1